MSLRFSPAVAEDAEIILELNRQLIHRYEDLEAIDYRSVMNWVAQNIRDNLPCFRRIFWEDQLAGYYCLTETKEGAELDSFFILPQYRCRGIGTEVLRHIIDTCNCSIFLYVFRRNSGAIALYRRMGFTVTQEVGKTRYIMTYQKQDC